MDRCEVRKSKSKVRSYLKRCKDALYGHQNEETCSITVHEDIPQSTIASTTSWYLTETDDSNDSQNHNNMQLLKGIKTNQAVDEQEAIDNEIKCMSMTETVPLVESQVNKVNFVIFFLLFLSLELLLHQSQKIFFFFGGRGEMNKNA